MKRNGFWRTILEIITLSNLMRININIFTLVNQISPEFEINHPHNIDTI